MGKSQIELYQSVLGKLSAIPAEYLQQVDDYLAMIQAKAKVDKAKAIMAFAGAWSDMSEKDFAGYLEETKKVGKELFSRKVEL